MVKTLIPLNRVDDAFNTFFSPRRGWSDSPWNGHTVQQVPHSDVLEGEKDFMISLDLPGIDHDALIINVEDQVLSIKAEREMSVPEGYQARRKELPNKIIFKRSFNLGSEVDADSISAKLERGVLTLTLPKLEKVQPKRIEVQ